MLCNIGQFHYFCSHSNTLNMIVFNTYSKPPDVVQHVFARFGKKSVDRLKSLSYTYIQNRRNKTMKTANLMLGAIFLLTLAIFSMNYIQYVDQMKVQSETAKAAADTLQYILDNFK